MWADNPIRRTSFGKRKVVKSVCVCVCDKYVENKFINNKVGTKGQLCAHFV